MARAHLVKAVIRKVSGTPADGSCQVYEAGGTTPIAQTMYTTDAGGTVQGNPIAFVNGVVEFYLPNPQRVRLDITPTGGSVQTFDNVDVPAPAGAALVFGGSGDIAASAVADTVAAGATGKVADAGHRHAREGFGTVTAQTSFGLSSSNGSAVTEARSDHTHGTPATPSAAAVGALPIGGGTTTGGVTITGGTLTASGTQGLRVNRASLFYAGNAGDLHPVLGDNVYWDGTNYRSPTSGVDGGWLDYGKNGLRWFPINAPGSADAVTSFAAVAFTVSRTGVLNAIGQIQENGTRVYSANNPPPETGMKVLGGASGVTTNATQNTSTTGISFTAPSSGRVAVHVAFDFLPAANDISVSLDNSTFYFATGTTYFNPSSGYVVPSSYGFAVFTGLTPGATYTVYHKCTQSSQTFNYRVEG